MLLVPQIFLKDGKVVTPDGTTSPIFKEDPKACAAALRDSQADCLLCMDLQVSPLGTSLNLKAIKTILEDLDIDIFVGGAFKTISEVETYVRAGCELVILGPIAYQKPDFLKDACARFPGKIATHIDVKAGHVTIPGYAVTSNKTPADYADYFKENGVRFILYSDCDAGGLLTDQNISGIEKFCLHTKTRVICTSEVASLTDIEKIVSLHVPRLDGIVLNRSLYQGKVDLRSAIAFANEIASGSESETALVD